MLPSLALMNHLRRPGQGRMMTGPRPMNGAPAPGQAPGGGLLGNGIGLLKGSSTNMNPTLPHFDEDRGRLGGMLDGQSAFAGQEWGGLIKQLQDRAAGVGPSLAEQQYRAASQNTTSALGSMSRGSASPGAARQALIQQGRVGQGMAAGVATARTEEQMGATQALTQALGTRDQLNQGAYLDILAQQLGLSRAQLEALTGNADRRERQNTASKQASAAKWGAVAGGLGGLAAL